MSCYVESGTKHISGSPAPVLPAPPRPNPPARVSISYKSLIRHMLLGKRVFRIPHGGLRGVRNPAGSAPGSTRTRSGHRPAQARQGGPRLRPGASQVFLCSRPCSGVGPARGRQGHTSSILPRKAPEFSSFFRIDITTCNGFGKTEPIAC